MPKLIRLAALVGFGCLTVFGAGASAQTKTATQKTVKPEAVKPIADVSGAATFKEYCTSCHGPEAKGNGPAAAALKKAPADLTEIGKRAGGKFPFTKVKAQIAGDDVIAAHGSRDMPTWGPLFKSVDTSGSVAELRLTNLVKYLEDIQAK
jgi:mono/diheme cytochrome c family protein